MPRQAAKERWKRLAGELVNLYETRTSVLEGKPLAVE
jgi:hypothetical protein